MTLEGDRAVARVRTAASARVGCRGGRRRIRATGARGRVVDRGRIVCGVVDRGATASAGFDIRLVHCVGRDALAVDLDASVVVVRIAPVLACPVEEHFADCIARRLIASADCHDDEGDCAHDVTENSTHRC